MEGYRKKLPFLKKNLQNQTQTPQKNLCCAQRQVNNNNDTFREMCMFQAIMWSLSCQMYSFHGIFTFCVAKCNFIIN